MAQPQLPKLEVPNAFRPLFYQAHPHYRARHLTWFGGRAAMKSWQVARGLLFRSLLEPQIILCGREYQNSIKDSVLSLLEKQARLLNINHRFDFQKTTIIADTGSEFLFHGLGRNISSIKSIEAVKTVWIEEAETTSQHTIDVLFPTIRMAGSQIITTFNTGRTTDPIYDLLVTNHEPQNYLCKVTYLNNKYCTPEVLAQAEKMQRTDPDKYANIWLGEPATRSDAQVLNGKYRVAEFEPPTDADGAYYGLDWGFSVDPTAGARMWIKNNVLYIDQEIYAAGVEVTELPAFVRSLCNDKSVIRADNARPELISHLRREGFNIKAADKWAGSVEDGITLLRSFDEIVIHPRCKNGINEARLWSYKTDRLTGDVLPVLIDAHNHFWDAVRYGLQPIIKRPPMPSVRVA